MFGYNFLVVTIRGMTVELDNFAGELAASFDHRYLDTGAPLHALTPCHDEALLQRSGTRRWRN